MDNSVIVSFYKKDIKIKANKGDRLINVLWDNNIEIDAFCGGSKKCGKCMVKLLKGQVTPITDNEKSLLSKEQIKNKTILACEHEILSDIEIEILNSKKEIKDIKAFYDYKVDENKLNPLVKKLYLNLEKPSIKDNRDDLKRILDNFDKDIKFDSKILTYISEEMQNGNYNVTVTIFDNTIIDIEGKNTVENNYGVVIDLGTTTIAGYLVDMNKKIVIDNYSCGNSQKKYGADVISRINYTLENNDGLEIMNKLANESIDKIINYFIASQEINYKDINLVLALGNTVMSHLITKCNPKGISRAPFAPVFTDLIKSITKEIGISKTKETCKFILLPNIAGYVGSDTVGVILSTDIDSKEGNWLAIDIGTNCELVLKGKDRILTCSTAAGPAFEGSCMSQGMRAESGAIYKFKINEENSDSNISISTIGNIHPIGICGSGYIDLVSELIKNKLINKSGRLLNKEKLSSNISADLVNRIRKVDKTNKFVISEQDEINKEVCITQEDISQLQLAKGAVRAGIEILLEKMEISKDDLDGILLAGAFGSNIDIDSAIRLGIIPNIDKEKIISVGNAAGSGGIKSILSEDIFKKSIEIHSKIEHVELSLHKDFSSIFAKGMIFKV